METNEKVILLSKIQEDYAMLLCKISSNLRDEALTMRKKIGDGGEVPDEELYPWLLEKRKGLDEARFSISEVISLIDALVV